jgi:hypothetical protein
MSPLPSVFDRLIDAAAMSLIVLTAGSIGVLCCRQPIRRMRIIVLTLAGCLFAPVINLLPGVPHWSLPRFQFERDAQIGKHEERESRTDERVSSIEEAASGDGRPSIVAIERSSGLSDVQKIDHEPALATVNIAGTDSLASIIETPATPTNNDAPLRDMESTLARIDTPAVSLRSSILHPRSSVHLDPRSSIAAAYVAGLAAVGLWWLAGLAGLLRVLWVASPAPESHRRLLRDIAGPNADRVRLLVSPRAHQPFTFAWRQPVIVLPAEMQEDRGWRIEDRSADADVTQKSAADPLSSIFYPRSSTRSALAHEWSHIARGDTWVWSFSGLVRLVYYYQPLCWWLRRQLRLCQDFLADSEAARQSSPTEYAEFLATRAIGRPLALGLGITAGKSDLYRRVSMLVKNQRPLEAHCPGWWSASVGGAAAAILVVAATFGGRTEMRAAPTEVATRVPNGELQSSASSEILRAGGSRWSPPAALSTLPKADAGDAIESPTTAGNSTEKAPTDTEVQLAAAPATADAAGVVDPADAEKRKLIDGVLARGEAIRSGVIEYVEENDFLNGNKAEFKGEFAFSGASSSYRQTIEKIQAISVNHNGYSFGFRGGNTPHLYLQLPGHTILGRHVWARSLLMPVPPELSSVNPADVRLVGSETINGVETKTLEWPAGETDKTTGLALPSELEAAKRTVRLHVAPQLGYAIVRLKRLDRFGLANAVAEFSEFKEVAPGIHFPFRAHIQSKGSATRTRVVNVSELNQPIAYGYFVIRLPAGTQVEDLRPHWNDHYPAVSQRAEFDKTAYPLRSFTLLAEEPAGLPPAVLAEMDRDLVPLDEWAKIRQAAEARERDSTTKKGPKPGFKVKRERGEAKAQGVEPTPPTSPAKPAPGSHSQAASPEKAPVTTVSVDKSKLRYSGKSFDEWRLTLVNDLDPETRVKALEALGALGANAYGSEAAAAIEQALRADDPLINEYKVQIAAFKALVQSGDAGIAVLEKQLDAPLEGTRHRALLALVKFAPPTDSAAKALLKAARDTSDQVRTDAYPLLVARHLGNDEVFEQIVQAFKREQAEVKLSILSRLTAPGIPIDRAEMLLSKALASDDGEPPFAAAVHLALNGPDSKSIVDQLQKKLLASGPKLCGRFVHELWAYQNDGRSLHAAIAIPALIAVLESKESCRGDDDGAVSPEDGIAVLGRIPSPSPEKIRFLLKAAEGKLQVTSAQVQIEAFHALAKMGKEAQEALPTLNRLLAQWKKAESDLSSPSTLPKNWESTIKAAIQRIEGK